MKDEQRRCPNCVQPLALKGLEVHFVRPDVCRLWAHDLSVHTCDAVGSGEGSLDDELARGIRTPWTSAEHKRAALAHLDGELLAFARSLPNVRVEDKDASAEAGFMGSPASRPLFDSRCRGALGTHLVMCRERLYTFSSLDERCCVPTAACEGALLGWHQ